MFVSLVRAPQPDPTLLEDSRFSPLRLHELLVRPVVEQRPPLRIATMIVSQPHSLVVRLLEQPHRVLAITEGGCDGCALPGVRAAREGPIEPFQPIAMPPLPSSRSMV